MFYRITQRLTKNKTRLLVIAPAIVVAFVSMVLALSGCGSEPISAAAAAPLEAKPDFQIVGLGVRPAVVNAGDEVIVYADITNSGNGGGDYLANLQINGATTEVRSVTLRPGDTQSVTFKLSRDLPQIYKVGIGGLTVPFTVSGKQQIGFGTSVAPSAGGASDISGDTAGSASCCSTDGSGATGATPSAGGASCCGDSGAPASTVQPGASVPVQPRAPAPAKGGGCCG